MRRLIPGMFLLVATALIGCSGSPSSGGTGANAGGAGKADMLVGVWQIVKFDGKDAPTEKEILVEFTKDGKLIAFGEEEQTYRVDGDKIYSKKKAEPKEDPEPATIKTLTADKLVISAKESDPKKDSKEKKEVETELKRKKK